MSPISNQCLVRAFAFAPFFLLLLLLNTFSGTGTLVSASPYSDPDVVGRGFKFNVDSPANLKGPIAFLPQLDSRSPVGNLTGRIVLPNSNDSPTGCDDNGQAVLFTPYQDNGEDFNNTILIVQNGPCYSDFTGLPILAVLLTNPMVPTYYTFLLGPYTYLVPVLLPIVYNDIAVMINYLTANKLNRTAAPIVATITGTGNLVETERAALRTIANTFTYSNDYADNALSNYGTGSTLLNAYPPSPSYDPCVSSSYLGGIYCENGHVVLFVQFAVGLRGSLSPAFGALTHMRVFSIISNQVSGAVDAETICSWTDGPLIEFIADGNQLSALPDCWQNIGANVLTLSLAANRLTATPSSVTTMTKLAYLSLSDNLISSLPSLSSLRSLVFVDLSSNNAVGNIFSFQAMTLIQRIDLHSNRISGTFNSSWLDGLSALTYLDLSFNQISGPLPNLIGTTAITLVALDNNLFVGDCPSSWSQLNSLTSLTASHNALTYGATGAVPFLNANALTRLDLSFNSISVPSYFSANNNANGGFAGFLVFFSCRTLTTLNLAHNMLTGPWLPAYFTVALFPFLTSLSLANNNITSLPSDLFAQFVPLTVLDVSYNNLTGGIPLSHSPLSNATFLSFVGNPQFAGVLPSWLRMSTTSFHSTGSQRFLSPDAVAVGYSQLVVQIDPQYVAYNGSTCYNGYYGLPPDCREIPALVSISGKVSNFTDATFGNQRFAVGLDTSWSISPGATTRVIFLHVTLFPSVFVQDSDQLTIYSANSSDSAIAQTWIGSQVQLLAQSPSEQSSVVSDSPPQMINVTVTVVNNAALVNFKTKSSAGKFFEIQYTTSDVCPDGYAYYPPTAKCEQVSSINILYVSLAVAVTVFVLLLIFSLSYILYRYVRLRRSQHHVPVAKIAAEDKWRAKVAKDIAKESVSIVLDVGSAASNFAVMTKLISDNVNPMGWSFIVGYMIAVVSSMMCLCVSLYFRFIKLRVLVVEYRKGVPTFAPHYHDHQQSNQQQSKDADVDDVDVDVNVNDADDEASAPGVGAKARARPPHPRPGPLKHVSSLSIKLLVDDPNVQLAAVRRELASLRLAVLSTLFSSLPYFVLNHVLLLRPPIGLVVSGSTASLYVSVFSAYMLLGFKIAQLLEWRVLQNQRADLINAVTSVHIRQSSTAGAGASAALDSPSAAGVGARAGAREEAVTEEEVKRRKPEQDQLEMQGLSDSVRIRSQLDQRDDLLRKLANRADIKALLADDEDALELWQAIETDKSRPAPLLVASSSSSSQASLLSSPTNTMQARPQPVHYKFDKVQERENSVNEI